MIEDRVHGYVYFFRLARSDVTRTRDTWARPSLHDPPEPAKRIPVPRKPIAFAEFLRFPQRPMVSQKHGCLYLLSFFYLCDRLSKIKIDVFLVGGEKSFWPTTLERSKKRQWTVSKKSLQSLGSTLILDTPSFCLSIISVRPFFLSPRPHPRQSSAGIHQKLVIDEFPITNVEPIRNR